MEGRGIWRLRARRRRSLPGAPFRRRLFRIHVRRHSAAAAVAQRRTRRRKPSSTRKRSSSQRPPEDTFGCEASERFGIARDFLSRFLCVSAQPIVRFRDELLCLLGRFLDERSAMRAGVGAKFLTQLLGLAPGLATRLLDSLCFFV